MAIWLPVIGFGFRHSDFEFADWLDLLGCCCNFNYLGISKIQPDFFNHEIHKPPERSEFGIRLTPARAGPQYDHKAIVPRAGLFIRVAHLRPTIGHITYSNCQRTWTAKLVAIISHRPNGTPYDIWKRPVRPGFPRGRGKRRPWRACSQRDDFSMIVRKTFLCGRGKIRGGAEK